METEIGKREPWEASNSGRIEQETSHFLQTTKKDASSKRLIALIEENPRVSGIVKVLKIGVDGLNQSGDKRPARRLINGMDNILGLPENEWLIEDDYYEFDDEYQDLYILIKSLKEAKEKGLLTLPTPNINSLFEKISEYIEKPLQEEADRKAKEEEEERQNKEVRALTRKYQYVSDSEKEEIVQSISERVRKYPSVLFPAILGWAVTELDQDQLKKNFIMDMERLVGDGGIGDTTRDVIAFYNKATQGKNLADLKETLKLKVENGILPPIHNILELLDYTFETKKTGNAPTSEKNEGLHPVIKGLITNFRNLYGERSDELVKLYDNLSEIIWKAIPEEYKDSKWINEHGTLSDDRYKDDPIKFIPGEDERIEGKIKLSETTFNFKIDKTGHIELVDENGSKVEKGIDYLTYSIISSYGYLLQKNRAIDPANPPWLKEGEDPFRRIEEIESHSEELYKKYNENLRALINIFWEAIPEDYRDSRYINQKGILDDPFKDTKSRIIFTPSEDEKIRGFLDHPKLRIDFFLNTDGTIEFPDNTLDGFRAVGARDMDRGHINYAVNQAYWALLLDRGIVSGDSIDREDVMRLSEENKKIRPDFAYFLEGGESNAEQNKEDWDHPKLSEFEQRFWQLSWESLSEAQRSREGALYLADKSDVDIAELKKTGMYYDLMEWTSLLWKDIPEEMRNTSWVNSQNEDLYSPEWTGLVKDFSEEYGVRKLSFIKNYNSEDILVNIKLRGAREFNLIITPQGNADIIGGGEINEITKLFLNYVLIEEYFKLLEKRGLAKKSQEIDAFEEEFEKKYKGYHLKEREKTEEYGVGKNISSDITGKKEGNILNVILKESRGDRASENRRREKFTPEEANELLDKLLSSA